MTDAEIIKALECCTNDDEPNCKECTKRPHIYCICELLEDAYGLIQRQQEEIEKLKNSRDRWKQLAKDFDEASREEEEEVERGAINDR